jgi:hypothetical protein
LLHLDIKKLGRFSRPGVRATGDRIVRNPVAGVEFLHAAIDDHSRLAFACRLTLEHVSTVNLTRSLTARLANQRSQAEGV